MSAIKINADDLILAYRQVNNHVYTLVLRADINRPDRWNAVPNTDMVVFSEKQGLEFQDYVNAIPRVQAFQRIKYPKLLEIEQRMRSEVSEFNRAIDSVYLGKQTKSK